MRFATAGERVFVESELPWVDSMVQRAVGGAGDARQAGPPTVRICVQAARTPFPVAGLRPITRGAVSDGRRAVLTDAGSSGFDLLVEPGEDDLSVTARYRPAARTRAANLVLSDRPGWGTDVNEPILRKYPPK